MSTTEVSCRCSDCGALGVGDPQVLQESGWEMNGKTLCPECRGKTKRPPDADPKRTHTPVDVEDTNRWYGTD